MSEFKYNFPLIVKNFLKRKQLEKIMEEFMEFLTAVDEDEKYTEWLDFLHSAETFTRHHMDQNKLEEFKIKVIKKNTDRGYYRKVLDPAIKLIYRDSMRFNKDCEECIYMFNHWEAYKCPDVCGRCGIEIKSKKS